MSSCSNESMKRAALDDNSDFRSYRSVVLNRRSALAFVPVRNNLFQFYSLRRPYEFRSRTISEKY